MMRSWSPPERTLRAPRRLRRPCAWVVALLLLACVLPYPAPAFGARKSPPRDDLRTFRQRVDALLARNGMGQEQAALLIYSPRRKRYLYRTGIERPMIAASNAKLVTTYAALKALTPDFRWRTRFFLVEENHDRDKPPRQGLLVQGSGDPSLTKADLERIALILKANGLHRLDGGIYLDGHLFDDVIYPASWGDVSRAQPWFAPVSPFIVSENVVDFMISMRTDGRGFEISTPTPGIRVVSTLKVSSVSQPKIRVEQQWREDVATFTLAGELAPSREAYAFSAAVERPRVHFYRQLRAALARARVPGKMPLRLNGAAPPPKRLLHTRLSPPLRELIVTVNKHSNNLAAEVLVRTIGLKEKATGVSTEDGLAVLRRVMQEEFYQARTQLKMVDGSGLSRENRVSALLMVRLLNRVREDYAVRPEFLNALSVSLISGTLQFRDYPARMRGRLRAKSGTLAGVSNLSGYLLLEREMVVFSFLVNDSSRNFLELQEAQDRVMTELYDALLELEEQKGAPARPAGGR